MRCTVCVNGYWMTITLGWCVICVVSLVGWSGVNDGWGWEFCWILGVGADKVSWWQWRTWLGLCLAVSFEQKRSSATAAAAVLLCLLYGISSWYHFRTTSHTLFSTLSLHLITLYLIYLYFVLSLCHRPLWFVIKEKEKISKSKRPPNCHNCTVSSTLLHHPRIHHTGYCHSKFHHPFSLPTLITTIIHSILYSLLSQGPDKYYT